MRKYELTYLISDNVPESDLNKVTGKINGYVTSLTGKILKEEIWGRRKLAYPIKKQDFATYVTINFDLPADKTNELERNIFLSSKIIRHLMILKDFGDEELTLKADEIVNADEIASVIGGEKSFEAIEGETEESKDLMAVREKDDDKKEEVEEIVADVKVEEAKPAKKAAKETEKKTETVEKEKKSKIKDQNVENEVDRLSKLDKELDDILGEEKL